MRPPTSQWTEYVKIRTKVLADIPDNIDVFSIKRVFDTLITSRRRFERITTIRQLVMELERQLIIFPDKRGIKHFYNLLAMVNQRQPQTVQPAILKEVGDMTTLLEPAPLSVPVPHQNHQIFRVPNHIRDMLATDLERCGGRDWEHFALGLGTGLAEKDKIRIKQGEVDYVERQQNGDIRLILHTVLTRFEERCMQKGVHINILDHLINILKNQDIFMTPLNRLANDIKKEKKKLQTN